VIPRGTTSKVEPGFEQSVDLWTALPEFGSLEALRLSSVVINLSVHSITDLSKRAPGHSHRVAGPEARRNDAGIQEKAGDDLIHAR
jgi:hypothetical protein